MIKLKNFIIICTYFIFVFCFINVKSFAAQPEYPDNFINLSIEQRIQWLDENITPETELATTIGHQRNIISYYESTKETIFRDQYSNTIAGISVTYNWSANLDDTIETYSIPSFIKNSYTPTYSLADSNTSSYYVNPSNVKVYAETNFYAAAYGVGVLIGQNVNLHGSGNISYAPVIYEY